MPITAKLDEYGKPAWIALIVLGFMAFWPIGLAILAFTIWSGRMGCGYHGGSDRWQHKMERMQRKMDWMRSKMSGGSPGGSPSGSPCDGAPSGVRLYETVSVGAGYVVQRNVRVYGEALYDTQVEVSRFAMGFTAAY